MSYANTEPKNLKNYGTEKYGTYSDFSLLILFLLVSKPALRLRCFTPLQSLNFAIVDCSFFSPEEGWNDNSTYLWGCRYIPLGVNLCNGYLGLNII